MKIFSNKLLTAVLAVALLAASQNALAQYTTINTIPVCWTTAGGVDSSLYVSGLDANQRSFPSRLYFYNTANVPVSVAGGSLRFGHCDDPTTDSLTIRLDLMLTDNDTFIVRFDSLLSSIDSLINVNTEPQICDCSYKVEMENTTLSIADNSQYIQWNYDRVARRNCGAGWEEVFRNRETTNGGSVYGRTSNAYVHQTTTLSNGGVIDSMVVWVKNPDETIKVYLSPATVKANYPIWPGDTSQLRFNTATVATYNAAIESVVAYAAQHYAANHVPVLGLPSVDFDANVTSGGSIHLRFWTTNNPASTYWNISSASASRRVWYRPTASGATVASTGVSRQGATASASLHYTLPCDTTITTNYTIILSDASVQEWATITINPLTTATLFGSIGQGECTMPCPEASECVNICNDETSPIPVYLVQTSTDTCLVRNITEFPVTASANSVSLAANLYHSVSIAVTSGTVVVSLVNSGSGITSATFTTGQTFNVRAAECSLLSTGFGINATSGAAIVSTIR